MLLGAARHGGGINSLWRLRRMFVCVCGISAIQRTQSPGVVRTQHTYFFLSLGLNNRIPAFNCYRYARAAIFVRPLHSGGPLTSPMSPWSRATVGATTTHTRRILYFQHTTVWRDVQAVDALNLPLPLPCIAETAAPTRRVLAIQTNDREPRPGRLRDSERHRREHRPPARVGEPLHPNGGRR